MPQERKNKDIDKLPSFQLLVCQECSGTGKKEGRTCPQCQGKGVAFWFSRLLFYWGKKINSLTIAERRVEGLARRFINGSLFLFALGGLIFFIAYIFYWQDFSVVTSQNFWLNQPPEMLVFWGAMMAFLYLVYRLDKESTLVQKVIKKKYRPEDDDQLGAAAWQEIAALPKEAQIDFSLSFSGNALGAVEKAWLLAKKFNHQEIRPIHILASLLFYPKIKLLFSRLGVDISELAKKINRLLNKQEFYEFQKSSEIIFSQKVETLLFVAYLEAYISREPQVSVVDLLLAVARQQSDAQEILYDLEIDFNKVKNVVQWIKVNDFLRCRSQEFRRLSIFKPKSGMDRAMTAVATPVLDHFSQDLTLMAKFGYLEPCIGRDKEIEDIFRTIEGNNQSVILVGEPGVGKRTIIEGIARRMVTEEVPEIIQDKRLVSLNVARLISGASPEEAQGRLMAIMDEIKRSGNIVLFVQDIQDMMGITPGGEESLDLAEVLVSEIDKGAFFAFATANSVEYRRYIENTSLGDAFQKVEVLEPKVDEAIQILEAKTARIEYQNKVYFSYDALEQAVKLSYRYIHDRYLPEKAIKIIEQAAVYVRKNKGPQAVVLGEDVARLISEKTDIPLSSVTEEESEKLLRLEEKIHERIVGQDEAVKAVAAALRRARAELRDDNRPIANFLFLGPTGVGKTELSKTVAEVYFGREDDMVRLDMSEYQEQSSIYRLIGSPPGNGGIGSPGYLTEAVRQNPYTLLLLDEIEKAHPDILNVFLQLMDDGRLTDGLGRTIDFTNVILIATSNAGTQFIQDKMKEGWETEKIKKALLEGELKKYFRPEFINRFDGVIVFKPLDMAAVIEITKLLLKKVVDNLAEKGINLEITLGAIKELARAGFDPEYGARPLKRVIQEKVSDYLAVYLLRGKIGRRDTVVLEEGGRIRIKKAKSF